MTYEEYSKLGQHQVPYVYTFKKNGKCIYYFGSKHSYDPNDLQFEQIKNFYNEFLKNTAGQPRITLIEGGNWPIMKTEKEAILQCGEAGYVAYLAHQAQVERSSPEPREKKRFAELEKIFTREEIIYKDFAQIVYQWSNMTTKRDFQEYANELMEADKATSGWTDFDFSISHMKEIHKSLFGTDFNLSNIDFFRNIVDPRKDTTVINRIAAFGNSGFRDRHILTEIAKYWKEGKNIFIIYGASHAVMQEAAIRSLT